MAKVQITDTILRDGHQSQAATRMRTDEMLPACEMLDKVGYYSLECWGGATYDACLRFLNEDPWERLRKLRKALPNRDNLSFSGCSMAHTASNFFPYSPSRLQYPSICAA